MPKKKKLLLKKLDILLDEIFALYKKYCIDFTKFILFETDYL